MTRRPAALATAVVAMLSLGLLSSCSTFDDSFAVASVDGHELHEDEFEAIAGNPMTLSLTQEVPTSTISGQAGRLVISNWVVVMALSDAGALDAATDDDATKWLDSTGIGWNTDDEAVPYMIEYGKLNLVINNGDLDPAEASDVLAAADVHVSSRYGVWDPVEGVVAVGAATA